MVKLTKIYTRGGDGGETSLVGGRRVSKHDPRVAAYGTVDETNSVLGVTRLHTLDPVLADADAMLARVQNDLFDLGADIATPGDRFDNSKELRIVTSQVARLETEIDEMNEMLSPLESFVLPGGTPAAAYLHLARTFARRAERLMTELAQVEPVNPEALKYINRLSDHLFVMARHVNGNGSHDVLWRPGLTRD